jgi:hypothetical protein
MNELRLQTAMSKIRMDNLTMYLQIDSRYNKQDQVQEFLSDSTLKDIHPNAGVRFTHGQYSKCGGSFVGLAAPNKSMAEVKPPEVRPIEVEFDELPIMPLSPLISKRSN